jgi:hypothetical protein
MTTTARDGGPVYPGNKAIQFGQDSGCNEGMSLRDYFALKAMEAEISDGIPMDQKYKDSVAAHAYTLADAMLKARVKT